MGLHQEIMNAAYDKFTESMSRESFIDALDAKERFAVHTGNLNYQVENGGWMQWFDNGYATAETLAYLRRQLPALGDVGVKVVNMIFTAEVTYDEAKNLDHDQEDTYAELSGNMPNSEFYALNTQFMAACEQRLANW